MESSAPVQGVTTKCTSNVRVKPLGSCNSDTVSLMADGKAKSKKFQGVKENTILIGDTDPKKK